MSNSKKLEKIVQMDKEYLYQNYGDRLPVCFTRGKGSELFDQDNNRYVDFFSGIAVNALGHGHPALTAALKEQVDTLIHTSNWFHNREQVEAAKLISETAFKGKTLFANSGTEANEAAIKLARKHGLSISKKKYRVITFENSFHGRTFGSMSATAQKKIRTGFGPVVPGFTYLPYNDIKALENEIVNNHENICAIMLELIQGEGGIIVASQKFVKKIKALAKKYDILVIIDEVQTGIARTGTMYAFQHYPIIPDILTLAKGLGSGVPVGVLHTKNTLVSVLPGGAHGTTFGGNHLACTAVSTTLKELSKKSVQNNISKSSQYIYDYLNRMKNTYGYIREIRGMGLHIGIELDRPGLPIVKKALSRGLVINCTAQNVLRIMPPLTIPMSIVKEGMKLFEDIIKEEGLSQ